MILLMNEPNRLREMLSQLDSALSISHDKGLPIPGGTLDTVPEVDQSAEMSHEFTSLSSRPTSAHQSSMSNTNTLNHNTNTNAHSQLSTLAPSAQRGGLAMNSNDGRRPGRFARQRILQSKIGATATKGQQTLADLDRLLGSSTR
jgi:hypothetical protein